MTAVSFLVQSALLMLAAYFLGVWLACMFRRILFPVSRRKDTAILDMPTAAPTSSFAPIAPKLETVERRQTPVPNPEPKASSNAAQVGASFQGDDAPGGFPAAVVSNEAGFVAADVVHKSTPPQDIDLIRYIGEKTAAILNGLGVKRYEDIANWTREDIDRVGKALSDRGRANRENWIEQAQLLAAGGMTEYARSISQNGHSKLARPSPDSGNPLEFQQLETASVYSPASVSSNTTGAIETADVTTADGTIDDATKLQSKPAQQARNTSLKIATRDDLQRIAGVNAEVERLLSDHGVGRFCHIADWNGDDVKRFNRLLGNSGRIERESWREQAFALSGQEERSEPEAGHDDADLTASMDTEMPGNTEQTAALDLGEPAALETGRLQSHSRSTGSVDRQDDLKRIRGVGVLIERRLCMLGFGTFEQIANWTEADIDRVSQQLDFRGRIEREHWVEQARILVAGGQTNFSRRFDTRKQ